MDAEGEVDDLDDSTQEILMNWLRSTMFYNDLVKLVLMRRCYTRHIRVLLLFRETQVNIILREIVCIFTNFNLAILYGCC